MNKECFLSTVTDIPHVREPETKRTPVMLGHFLLDSEVSPSARFDCILFLPCRGDREAYYSVASVYRVVSLIKGHAVTFQC